MLLLMICIILAISTVGFGLFSFFLAKELLRMTAVHASFTNKLAVYIEVMTINDKSPDTTDKKELSFQILEAFKIYNQYWKKVPPQLELMLRALKRKYGERPAHREKSHGLRIVT